MAMASTMAVAGIVSSIAFSSSTRLTSLHQQSGPVSRLCSVTEKYVLLDTGLGASSRVSTAFSFSQTGKGNLVTQAVAETQTDIIDVEAGVEGVVEEKASLDEVSKLKLESDVLKKKVKRAELRRKRLVRKRHLRKKGRWPPSKMAKLKNV